MKNKNCFGEIKSPHPERLREARLARGLSIADLAKELGVTRQAVSRYELGNLKPSPIIIDKMSEILNFPISFFAKDIGTEQNTVTGATYFRSLKSADSDIRDMIRIRTKWTHEVFEILNNYLNFPNVDLPNIDSFIDSDHLTMEDIEEITLEVRKQWGLGLSPINNMTILLEKKGFIITGSETGSLEADACSQMRNFRPFIFLGKDKKSAVRTRFNLAHELGHILLHNYIREDDLKEKELLDKIEREANMFAAAFLMPKESFSSEIMSLSLDHFITLKKRWKVSIAAMIYRCQELEILSPEIVLYLRKQMSVRKWNRKEPLDDELPIEHPTLLKTAINMFIDKPIMSHIELLELFNWTSKDMEEICNMPPGTFNTNAQVIHIDFINRT